MWELVRITGDLFSISDRLREIDERYELFRNRRLHRFEVYAGGALQFAAPFDVLDCRLLGYARETRVENRAKLLAEIERNNERLDREARARAIERALAAADV